ncbi:MAG TPA: MotA/TolQ/ExbB proton channel family protein [Phycisphaerales bacterium]|nr:MotA/TolQ/ExbB proton channel family protein [Phycisphaerales bacterium]
MRGWRRIAVIGCAAAVIGALANGAHGQSTGSDTTSVGSFASAFFISRVTSADGKQSLDIIGSMMLWTLLAMSVASIGLIGHVIVINKKSVYMPDAVTDSVKKLMGAGRFREAIEVVSADESFFSTVAHAGLKEAPHGYGAMMRTVEETSDELTMQKFRRVEYLNVMAQVSPMLGLFGTIWGMILAFRSIVEAGGNASPVLLAGGIGTALTTTFWGLLIAIPALTTYALVRNRVDELTTHATRRVEELLEEFKPKGKSEEGEAKPKLVTGMSQGGAKKSDA